MEEILKKMQSDLLDSIKSGNTEKTDILRLAVSDIKTEQINTGEVSVDRVHKILLSNVKAMRDASTQYESAGKKDLAEKELRQIKFLEEYLPQMMSEEEVATIVDSVIHEMNPSGMQDMGKVMGMVMQKVSGKADGSIVQNVVKSKLSSI